MFKKFVAPVIIGGALLGAVATPGAADAATPAASTPAPSHVTKGQIKAWVRAHRKELRKAGLDISAQTIGIPPKPWPPISKRAIRLPVWPPSTK